MYGVCPTFIIEFHAVTPRKYYDDLSCTLDRSSLVLCVPYMRAVVRQHVKSVWAPTPLDFQNGNLISAWSIKGTADGISIACHI